MNQFTLSELCRPRGWKVHSVRYALEQAGIVEARRFGHVRVFSAEQLPAIIAAVRRYTKLPINNAMMVADLPSIAM